MGHGLLISCENCNYQKQFLFGIGFRHALDPLSELHQKKKKQMVMEIAGRNVLFCEAEKKAFGCTNCSSLSNQIYVVVTLEDGTVIESIYECSKCKQTKKQVAEKDFKEWACPKCQEKKLIVDARILWD